MGNVIIEKSFSFALKVVKLAKEVRGVHEYELAKQVLRSGTSIGANVAEAQRGQSRRDFLAKMYIAAKEASETEYWIRILHGSGIISDTVYRDVSKDIDEIIKIITSIIKSTEEKHSLIEQRFLIHNSSFIIHNFAV